jgi:hypothetical protein
MNKIKASQNRAKDIETKPPVPPKTIEEMSSEELGLALPQQYQTLAQVQQNIQAITKELDTRSQRRLAAEKEKNDAAGTK